MFWLAREESICRNVIWLESALYVRSKPKLGMSENHTSRSLVFMWLSQCGSIVFLLPRP